MELLEMVIIILQITTICARKKHKSAVERRMGSDESIENLLYYKDCKHKNKDATPEPLVLRTPEPPRQPACPCPRMCCSMCCDCNAPQSFIERQMAPLQQTLQSAMMEPMQMSPQSPRQPPMAVQPQIVQRGIKKKKPKLPMKPNLMIQPPIGSRRGFGFTRENIKNLISKDQDIKKILKDLVRVTMNKVDLVEKVNARRNFQRRTSTTELPVQADEEDYID